MHILPAYPLAAQRALPNHRAVLWVGGALAFAAAPQVLNLPIWLSLLSLTLGLWRLQIAQRGWPLPPKRLYLLLALLSLGGVYVQFGTVLGRDAGVALLTVMLALKLLETRTQRDCMLLVFLGYFLCITSFLYTQTFFIALYILLAVWALTAALIHLNQPAGDPALRFNLRLAGSLLVQALPFMLVLFILFPRVQGTLWTLPRDARGGASTGLSEEMTPGNISSLARSSAVAFRAAFNGRLPEPAERYWRGPVFWFADGRNWSPGRGATAGTVELTVFGQPLDYAVTLEPHQKSWLLALEMPASIPASANLTADFQLRAITPVESRVRYELISYPRYRTGALSPADLARALQLPRDANPQTRSLAKSWRANFPDDEKIVAQALAYFRGNPFFYTLNPPPLRTGPGDNPVDEFMFGTRRGFCEHYSAAFTTLMRAAGIPARVVTGYQGGELNPLGDYLIVRQSDAHAWAEVWLKERGWVRVDPTAAVAPQRIERGGTMLDDLAESGGFFSDPRQGLFGEALLKLRMGFDSANYQWAQWVLGYNTSRQSELLAHLGLDRLGYDSMALGLGMGVSLTLLFIAFAVYSLLLIRRRPKDPIAQLYRSFCAKLAKRGIVRAPAEGPQDFAARAATHFPQHAPQIYSISQLYSALRYANRYPERAFAELRNYVRSFHV
ncbi:MAG: DUF3488 and transglutaminase-like domain-containing protein [Gammaproteobacteria bacterium]